MSVKFLDSNGVRYLWQKVTAKLTGYDTRITAMETNKADKQSVNSQFASINQTISQYEIRIKALEQALAQKQDKIDNWGDLTE